MTPTPMPTRLALALLVSALLAIAAAYAGALFTGAAPAFAPAALAYGIGASMTAFMILGAARRGRLAPVAAVACALTFVLVTGSFGAALLLPAAEGAGGALLLGLPRRTALVLYGVGVLPLLALPLAFAWTFEDEGDDDRVPSAEGEGAR